MNSSLLFKKKRKVREGARRPSINKLARGGDNLGFKVDVMEISKMIEAKMPIKEIKDKFGLNDNQWNYIKGQLNLPYYYKTPRAPKGMYNVLNDGGLRIPVHFIANDLHAKPGDLVKVTLIEKAGNFIILKLAKSS